MGHVEGSQCLQPSGLFGGYRREALDPSRDGGLVATGASGEFALGPAEDGEADQQPVAGHGALRRGRFRLQPDIIDRLWLRVFIMNTPTISGLSLRRVAVVSCRFRARGLSKGFGEMSLQGGFHRQIVTGDGANGSLASGIVMAEPRRRRLAASSPRLRR